MSVKTVKKDGSGTYNLFLTIYQKFKLNLNILGMIQSLSLLWMVKLPVQRAPTMAVQRAPPWLFNKHVLSQWQQVVWAKETYIKL